MDARTTVRALPAEHESIPTQAGVPEAILNDPRAGPRRPISAQPLMPGTAIGRYVIHKVLGRGGMGIVYGAVDPPLGRRVAIKLVRAEGRNAVRFRDRLQREALALARLCHPNIVALFDIGTNRHGTFVAMEYIRGIDLRRWLRVAPRSVDDILEVFAAAGEGLAAAHEAGLVHRDFKPTNVMVTEDRAVKVLDFGLVRGERSVDPWLEATDGPLLAQRLTRADTIVGTTGYMPPEQLRGHEVGPASDQFAFSVAMFEALHGTRPFPGKTPIEQARSYRDGIRTTVEPRRDVPQRVQAALERGMSLDPRDRFYTMRDLLEALATPKTPSRRRRALLVGALVLGTAVTSSLVTTWLHAPTAVACQTR